MAPKNPEDEHWMAEALREADAAAAAGEVPVGAVVVLDGAVIGRGHNLVETRGSATAHAEMIALNEATRVVGGWRLIGATLYATLEPCAMCAGASILSRIERVVFGARDPKFGACGSVIDVFADEAQWNHRVVVVPGVLAEDSADRMRRFFAGRRAG